MSPTVGQIPTCYSPVRHSPAPNAPRRDCYGLLPFDLHVLGLPPAFNLSQDQTLQFKMTFRGSKPTNPGCVKLQPTHEQLNYGIKTQKRPHNLPNQFVKDLDGLSDTACGPPLTCEYTLYLFEVKENYAFNTTLSDNSSAVILELREQTDACQLEKQPNLQPETAALYH